MIWHITLITGSGLMITLATVFGFVPQIIISIFSGVWADRYNRKHLILIADGLVAIATLILVVFFLIGFQELWLLFLVMAIRSLGSGIQGPAVSSVLPQLVPKASLIRVNGINSTLQNSTMLIAPAVSGVLLTVATIESIFFIDVITAVIGMSMLVTIPIPFYRKVTTNHSKTSYFKDLKGGFQYIKDHKNIWLLMIIYLIFMFFLVPAASLSPLMVTRVFGSDVWRLTAIEITFSIGAILGGLLMASWGGFKNRITTIALSAFGFGIFSILLSFMGNFPVFLVVMGFLGMGMPLFNTPVVTYLQETIEPDMQGRVFGLVQTIGMSAMPLGLALFGPLADYIAIEILIFAAGIVLIGIGFVTAFSKISNKQKE